MSAQLMYDQYRNSFLFPQIYPCPLKMHHSSDAHSCDLSNVVKNCVIYDYYSGQV